MELLIFNLVIILLPLGFFALICSIFMWCYFVENCLSDIIESGILRTIIMFMVPILLLNLVIILLGAEIPKYYELL